MPPPTAHPHSGSLSQRPTSPADMARVKRALERAISEFEAHRQLQTDESETKRLPIEDIRNLLTSINQGLSPEEILKAVDAFFETLSELDRAANDLHAGTELQVKEIVEEFEAFKLEKIGLPKTNIDEVENEIDRRRVELERISEPQEGIENELARLRDEIERLEALISTARSENPVKTRGEINALKAKITENEKALASTSQTVQERTRELEQLIGFKAAYETIRNGLPENLIRKQKK